MTWKIFTSSSGGAAKGRVSKDGAALVLRDGASAPPQDEAGVNSATVQHDIVAAPPPPTKHSGNTNLRSRLNARRRRPDRRAGTQQRHRANTGERQCFARLLSD